MITIEQKSLLRILCNFCYVNCPNRSEGFEDCELLDYWKEHEKDVKLYVRNQTNADTILRILVADAYGRVCTPLTDEGLETLLFTTEPVENTDNLKGDTCGA